MSFSHHFPPPLTPVASLPFRFHACVEETTLTPNLIACRVLPHSSPHPHRPRSRILSDLLPALAAVVICSPTSLPQRISPLSPTHTRI